jgi:large subunit ribosomal protein L25
MLTLDIKKRDVKNDLYKLRNSGFIPAVFYGPKEASTPVAVFAKDFAKVFKEAGESTVVTLTGDFGEHDAMIHQVDLDPISGQIQHADFYVVEKGKKVTVSIPVEFEGVAPAVKDLGGVLVKVLHEVEVEAMPKDLPHEVHVDISALVDFETQITASDIKLASNVSLVTKPDEIVALVSAPKEEVESSPIDITAIEVEKKGKEVKDSEDSK